MGTLIYSKLLYLRYLDDRLGPGLQLLDLIYENLIR